MIRPGRRLLRVLPRSLFSLAALGLVTSFAATAGAVTITVNNLDGAGTGFNDTTAVAAVGGNSGTTVGQQRLNVFHRAADLWGAALVGTVPILVDAHFAPIPCDGTGSFLLGHARTIQFTSNAAGDTWLPMPLANQLEGADLDPTESDIDAEFNGNVLGCSGGAKDWYYGFDGNAGDNADLLSVVLHEMAHGLGFSSLISVADGVAQQGLMDSYTLHVYDDGTAQAWSAMTATQRVTSAQNARQLVWNGQNVQRQAAQLLVAGTPILSTQPTLSGLSGRLGEAAYGTYLSAKSASGPLVVLGASIYCDFDSSVSGAIVLSTETCAGVQMAHNAEALGAKALLLAESRSDPPFSVSTRPTYRTQYPVGIPVLAVTNADGALLQGSPQNTIVQLTANSQQFVGADAQGRPYLFASRPVLSASTLSHWDNLARPDLLLEPEAATDPVHDMRMELALFRDIGWQTTCGNGTVNTGEACDLGAQNGASGSACRSDCTVAGSSGTGGMAGGTGGMKGSGGMTGGVGGMKGSGGMTGGVGGNNGAGGAMATGTGGGATIKGTGGAPADGGADTTTTGGGGGGGCHCATADVRSSKGALPWVTLMGLALLVKRRRRARAPRSE